MADEATVSVKSDADVLLARQNARTIAATLRFSSADLTLIATAVSEVARNIVLYAVRGEVLVHVVRRGNKRGIAIIARDSGPGIPDIARAMADGYSTSGGLGIGLPGAKRLMDEFEITSAPGLGTTVTMTKWET